MNAPDALKFKGPIGTHWDDLVRSESGWRIVNRTFEVTITLGDPSVLQPG